jgi:hypothetical protein
VMYDQCSWPRLETAESNTVQKCLPYCPSKAHTLNACMVNFTLGRTELTPLSLHTSSPTLEHTCHIFLKVA